MPMDASVYSSWTKVQRELRSFIQRKVRDNDLADDIVQDVFIKLHTHSTRVRDLDKITGWIFQVARNSIIDQFRKQSRQINPLELEWENEDTHFLNDCVAQCLNVLVDTLPKKYREALLLTEKQNLSQTALAETLGISYSGAKSRVQRARKKLRDKLEELYLIETDRYGNIIRCEDRKPCNCQFREYNYSLAM